MICNNNITGIVIINYYLHLYNCMTKLKILKGKQCTEWDIVKSTDPLSSSFFNIVIIT
jgi:hypothetical protein